MGAKQHGCIIYHPSEATNSMNHSRERVDWSGKVTVPRLTHTNSMHGASATTLRLTPATAGGALFQLIEGETVGHTVLSMRCCGAVKRRSGANVQRTPAALLDSIRSTRTCRSTSRHSQYRHRSLPRHRRMSGRHQRWLSAEWTRRRASTAWMRSTVAC